MRHTRRQDVITRVLDGEVVILDREAGQVHQLNAVASAIWNACNGAHTEEQIVADLAATFEHVPDTVLSDVRKALEDFNRLGLLLSDADSAGPGGLEPGT